MVKKVFYAIWVLMNIYVIISACRTSYQHFSEGYIISAIFIIALTVGFTALTAFIIYRDIKSAINKKKDVKVYPHHCGICKHQDNCPNKMAEFKLLCGIDECKYWEDWEEE